MRSVLKVPALGRRSCALGKSTDNREAGRHPPKVRAPTNLLMGVNLREKNAFIVLKGMS